MKRLLVIRLGALGDLAHLSAALDAVREARPDLEIHLLTRPIYAQLAAMMPSVHQSWFWNPHDGWPALLQIGNELRQSGMEMVVNLHPSVKTWLLTRLIHPRKEAVYHKQKLRQKGSRQRHLTRRHAVEDFYEPFKTLLSLPETNGLTPILQQSQSPSANKTSGPAKEGPEIRIGLIPGVGGKRGNRAWPPAAWIALMQNLLREIPNLHILLLGGADEKTLAVTLQRGIALSAKQAAQSSEAAEALQERIINHCGASDIHGTAALMRQCRLVIGGDTGPLHLAAGLGIPVIGLFGPTSPARTGPKSTAAIEIFTPPETLSCWPCEAAVCPLSGDASDRCMRDIPVDAVQTAIRRILSHP